MNAEMKFRLEAAQKRAAHAERRLAELEKQRTMPPDTRVNNAIHAARADVLAARTELEALERAARISEAE